MRELSPLPALIATGSIIAVASWWFMQLSLLTGTNSAAVGDISLQALRTLLLLQLLSISLFAPLWIGKPDKTARIRSTAIIASAIFPAWPLLAMLSLLSGLSAIALTRTEVLVLAAGFSITLLARAIQKLPVDIEVARLLQSSLGLGAAATTWVFRAEWLQWITV